MGIERALHHKVVLVFHHGHIPIQTKLAYPIMSTDIDSAMSQPLLPVYGSWCAVYIAQPGVCARDHISDSSPGGVMT